MKKITIVLAEDHTIVLEGFRKLLESETDIECIGEAKTGAEAVKIVVELHPDVVVMDIAMPHLNGLEAMRQIRKAAPDTRILMLSAHSDDAYIQESLALGATGYLLKQSSGHALAEAIRATSKGKPFFHPLIAKRIRSHSQQTIDEKGQRKQRATRLTPREAEVLQQIAEGSANKQIAGDLDISIKTVEKHRTHLMDKLNIHDTAGLTRYAIESGIIESSVHLTIL